MLISWSQKSAPLLGFSPVTAHQKEPGLLWDMGLGNKRGGHKLNASTKLRGVRAKHSCGVGREY